MTPTPELAALIFGAFPVLILLAFAALMFSTRL